MKAWWWTRTSTASAAAWNSPRNDDPKKIEQDLMKIIPREKWTLFSHQMIWHGRKLCIARRPNAWTVRWKISATPPTRPGARSRSTRTQSSSRRCHPERSMLDSLRIDKRSRRTPSASARPQRSCAASCQVRTERSEAMQGSFAPHCFAREASPCSAQDDNKTLLHFSHHHMRTLILLLLSFL